MAAYRYVSGAPATVFNLGKTLTAGYSFERYGQLVDLPEELAQDIISKGIALLTLTEFASLGHTPDELKRYSRFESHNNSSAEFKSRRDRAWKMLADKRKAIGNKEALNASN